MSFWKRKNKDAFGRPRAVWDAKSDEQLKMTIQNNVFVSNFMLIVLFICFFYFIKFGTEFWGLTTILVFLFIHSLHVGQNFARVQLQIRHSRTVKKEDKEDTRGEFDE